MGNSLYKKEIEMIREITEENNKSRNNLEIVIKQSKEILKIKELSYPDMENEIKKINNDTSVIKSKCKQLLKSVISINKEIENLNKRNYCLRIELNKTRTN